MVYGMSPLCALMALLARSRRRRLFLFLAFLCYHRFSRTHKQPFTILSFLVILSFLAGEVLLLLSRIGDDLLDEPLVTSANVSLLCSVSEFPLTSSKLDDSSLFAFSFPLSSSPLEQEEGRLMAKRRREDHLERSGWRKQEDRGDYEYSNRSRSRTVQREHRSSHRGKEEKARVVQTMLFVAGISTLMQSNFGTRLPVIMGGSFPYILPTISIILSERFTYYADPYERFEQTMRALQGAFIAGSSLQILLGFLGIWRIVVRYLSPLSVVPIVALAGLGFFYVAFPLLANCIEIGLPALIILVFLSQYALHAVKTKRDYFGRFAIIITIVIVWVYAHILTVAGAYKHTPPTTQISCRTDRSGLIYGSPWFRMPYPLQWGSPTFHAGDAFAMMAASFVALLESTGAIIAAARFSGATPVPPSIFSRGVGWQGIGILLAGMFGTVSGLSTSVENVGLLVLTRIGSRRVSHIAAGFMLFFSILGKFGAVIASIPLPIIAAIYCILFAYTASAGFGFLQFCNLNSLRTKFILGFSLFMGLSVAQYFREHGFLAGNGPVHTHLQSFNDIVNVIFSSPVTVAAIVAYFLDVTLIHGETVRRDRGWHWWEKFRFYKTDTRSEEFYRLPYNLNKFFPSL